jgi:hypothetical protein
VLWLGGGAGMDASIVGFQMWVIKSLSSLSEKNVEL